MPLAANGDLPRSSELGLHAAADRLPSFADIWKTDRAGSSTAHESRLEAGFEPYLASQSLNGSAR